MGTINKKSTILGGLGGEPFATDDDATELLSVKIHYGSVIDSISFEYVKNGEPKSSGVKGGSGGPKVEEIELKQGEYLVSITGQSGPKKEGKETVVIRSLTFHTNIRPQLGPYGTEDKKIGTPFSLTATNDEKIVGFHGRAAQLLDAIGVYWRKIDRPTVPTTTTTKETVMVGPWGGPKGEAYDIKGSTRLTGVKIMHGNVIDSITFHYEIEGTPHSSSRFGGPGGNPTEFKLEPNEFITSIKGFYGDRRGEVVIQSLTFFTSNKGQHGPYGRETGTLFTVPVSKGKIVSFYGLATNYLASIGVHIAQ